MLLHVHLLIYPQQYLSVSGHHQTYVNILQEHGSEFRDFFDGQLQHALHGECEVINPDHDSNEITNKLVRIQFPGNLRVPPLGSSMGGESGPKARPKGVVDGKQVNIPVLI
jgi:hypothetical protein